MLPSCAEDSDPSPFSSRVTLAYTTLPTSRNLSFKSCQEVLKLKLEMKQRFLRHTDNEPLQLGYSIRQT